MSKAVILEQVPYFGPGRLASVLGDFGIPTDIRKLHKGDEVPSDLDDIRLLIVLDGPMSVADADDAKHPFLSREIELLKRCVALDRATLGIGLGAQLLAHAAGAKVSPNAKPAAAPDHPATPMPEFGWFPVTFPFPGGTEPMVMGMHDGAMMFHWHRDTFDLPRLPAPPNSPPPPAPPPPTGNALLSSSKACKNQAFRFKTRLFGFQYHFELTDADFAKILSGDAENAGKVLASDDAARIIEDAGRYMSQYTRLGDRLIRNVVQFLKVY